MSYILDVARGAYSGLPAEVRRYLGKLLQVIPVGFRFGKTYLNCRRVIERARREPPAALGEQQERLRRVLQVAFEKAPYYRELFTAEFGPNLAITDLVRADNWNRIPILTNSTVREHKGRMCTVAPTKLDSVTTGGSSGQPLAFYLDKNRSPTEYAYMMDVWGRAGCNENDWRASFRGFQISNVHSIPFEIEPGLKELRISAYHMRDELMQRYFEEIERRKIRFLQGYPSALATFAAFLIRHHLEGKVQGILLHSEVVHAAYRDLLRRAFPSALLLPFYGLSERCAYAVEAPDHPDIYDFDPIYGFTELVDDGGLPVTERGGAGRLVSTGLQFLGMPFIRYYTGDEATLIDSPCSANGYRLRVASIVPRMAHDYLVSRANHLIQVGALMMMEKELAVTDIQFEQDTPGLVRMKAILAAGVQVSALDAFVNMVRERSSGELIIVPELVSSLPLTARGKRRLVVQHLDVAQLERKLGMTPVN